MTHGVKLLQLIELIISDDFKNIRKLNLKTPNKSYTEGSELCVKVGFVSFFILLQCNFLPRILTSLYETDSTFVEC